MNIVGLWVLGLIVGVISAGAQIIPASPANWLYPYGNAEATRHQSFRSDPQRYDSLVIKWAISEVYGDIQPLVGNIVSNERWLPQYPWGPNEFAVVLRDSLLIYGADGKRIATMGLPPHVYRPSILFDSSAILPNVYTVFPVIIGLEVVEHESFTDSATSAYIAAYDAQNQQLLLIKRLTVDLRSYRPNNAASVAPIFGRTSGSEMVVYATVNMSNPKVVSQTAADPPFFRGLTFFETSDFRFPFPRPDVLDDPNDRYTVGPEVTVSPPSITVIGNQLHLLLPCYPTPTLSLSNPISNPYTDFTFPNSLYLFHLNLQNTTPAAGSAFTPLLDFAATQRPRIRPIFVQLTDAGQNNTPQTYILLAEEYYGRDGSQGVAALHLFDLNGTPLTFPRPYTVEAEESFEGNANHLWSIAVGDVDGLGSNESLPYYPNNPGNEIIVTQSSPNFDYPNNRLMILRYRTGQRIPKPNIAQDSLRYFDTIVTHRIAGWVAAVADFDGQPDGKEEIFIVNNSTLRILRMRDYADPRFILGEAFDTLYSITFPNETIFSVAIVDMEGDGYLDILVTTSQRTYLIGKKIVGAIVLQRPLLPQTLCDGDSLILEWVNYTGGNPSVAIWFRPYLNGIPTNVLIPIVASLDNTGDTVRYTFVYNSDTLTGEGRFIIQSLENPQVKDSTGIIRLQAPTLTLETPQDGDRAAVGTSITVQGKAYCLEEILLQYGYRVNDTIEWFDITLIQMGGDSSYSYDFTIPCLPFFPCDQAAIDSLLFFRAIGVRFLPNRTLRDTSNVRTIIVVPQSFSLSISQPTNTICPERMLQWSPLADNCDTLLFYLSLDSGTTFLLIDTLDGRTGSYLWRPPVNLPDTVFLHLCCQDGCLRADTILTGVAPQYVQAIAPNPFDPTRPEPLTILYSSPQPTLVTIKIFDSSNRLIVTLVDQQYREPNVLYCDRWDGTIRGALVPNGIYYIMLEFDTGHREVYPVFVAKGY